MRKIIREVNKFAKCVNSLSPQELERLRWKQHGESCRTMRLALSITLNEMSEKMGCNPRTIARFEDGCKMMWRSVMEKSYDTSLKLIMKERLSVLDKNS